MIPTRAGRFPNLRSSAPSLSFLSAEVAGILMSTGILLLSIPVPGGLVIGPDPPPGASPLTSHLIALPPVPGVQGPRAASTPNATGNLTAALSRAVLLVGLAAGAVVTLVWSRVAISWFSHDASRKVQAKDRARDAAIGSLVLVAAVSGLAWGLVHFVLTGS